MSASEEYLKGLLGGQKNVRWEPVIDNTISAKAAFKTIDEVLKIEHVSLRNALLEEIVGLLRNANKAQYIGVSENDRG